MPHLVSLLSILLHRRRPSLICKFHKRVSIHHPIIIHDSDIIPTLKGGKTDMAKLYKKQADMKSNMWTTKKIKFAGKTIKSKEKCKGCRK